MDKLLKSSEVLKILGITRQTFYTMVKKGRIKAVRLTHSGKYLVKESELQRFLESCEKND